MIREGFLHAGYTLWKFGILRKEFEPAFVGSVGLNHDTERGVLVLKLNPVIGVYSREVGRQLAIFEGKPDPYETPHISMPLGYLMPEPRFRMWIFESEIDNQAVLADMLGAIEDHGIPWMRANSNLVALSETMLSGKYGFTHQLAYSAPVGLYLLGRHGEALTLARKNMDERKGLGGDYEEGYRAFVQRVEAAIEATDAGSAAG